MRKIRGSTATHRNLRIREFRRWPQLGRKARNFHRTRRRRERDALMRKIRRSRGANARDLNSRDARHVFCFLFFFPGKMHTSPDARESFTWNSGKTRSRGPKDTGRTSGSGGCKKKQRIEAGLPEYYWTERGCPIANSSHLFVCLAFGCAGGCTASILTRKLPN